MSAAWNSSPRTSGRFGTPEVIAETGSTNSDLAERARRGAPPGQVLIARHQTAGRGRQGRTWFDRPGSSLLMSWSIDIDAVLAPLVPLVAGTAVVEAVNDIVGRPVVALKWPNDVLAPGHDERKLTGILAEAVPTTPTSIEGVLRVIVGMGTNLDLGLDEPDVPAEVRDRAIDLHTLAGEEEAPSRPVRTRPPQVVEGILDACDRELDTLERSPAEALDRYRDRCRTIGRTLRFETPSGHLEGVATGITDDGALVLETGAGTVHHLTAGDAHHIG